MRKKKKTNEIDPRGIKFCGGSKMIVGDYDVWCAVCAMLAGIQAINDIPIKKRSYFHQFMLEEWSRLIADQADWMIKLERTPATRCK